MNEITLAFSEAATDLSSIAPIHEWGLSVIRAFQSAGNPVLNALARFFTLLGDPITYLLIIPIVFWCIDEKRGFKIGLTVFISNGFNILLKENLKVLRPFYHDPSVKLIEQGGYSTPSGHSQNSATFWPILFARKKILPADIQGEQTHKAQSHSLTLTPMRLSLALLLPTLIGLSRIYLGVHYPTDVFFGWALGAIVSIFYILFLPNLMAKIGHFIQARFPKNHSTKSFKLVGATAVAFVLNAFSGTDSSMGGLVFGFAAGYIFLTEPQASTELQENTQQQTVCEKPKRAFNASEGSIIKKIARLALGLTILAIIYFGLKMVLPTAASPWYTLCRFLRYGIAGFWASWGAPNLFILTGLSKNDQ